MNKDASSFLAIAVIIVVAIVAATIVIVKTIDTSNVQDQTNYSVTH